MISSEFVDLCAKLRELGCTSVEVEGYKATFTPRQVLVPAEKSEDRERFLPIPPIGEGLTKSPDEHASAVEARRLERARAARILNGG